MNIISISGTLNFEQGIDRASLFDYFGNKAAATYIATARQ